MGNTQATTGGSFDFLQPQLSLRRSSHSDMTLRLGDERWPARDLRDFEIRSVRPYPVGSTVLPW